MPSTLHSSTTLVPNPDTKAYYLLLAYVLTVLTCCVSFEGEGGSVTASGGRRSKDGSGESCSLSEANGRAELFSRVAAEGVALLWTPCCAEVEPNDESAVGPWACNVAPTVSKSIISSKLTY